jgi:hypothetical protein
MLVVMLLLPLFLAMNDGKFDHGGGGGGGCIAAWRQWQRQWWRRWTMIGGKSSWQQER